MNTKPEKKIFPEDIEEHESDLYQGETLFLCLRNEGCFWHKVYADSASEAAKKYCKRVHDRIGYSSLENVLVRTEKQEEDKAVLYEVSVKMVRVYSAHTVEETEEG
jgi:hypothetical protein